MDMKPASAGYNTGGSVLKRKVALLAFAVAAIAALGLGFGARSASAAGPQAHPGGPYSALVGSAIQFDGTASSGVGLSYFWSFGDGTSAVGARPVKAYAASNVYTVTLTVTDVTGAQSVASTTATIFGSRTVIPSGCFISGIGTVFCGQAVSNVVPGCVLTVSGWICPGSVAFPGVISPGVIVSSPLFPAAVGPNCSNPNHARTPFCQNMQ
jgi:hypothetical protein